MRALYGKSRGVEQEDRYNHPCFTANPSPAQ